MKKKILLIIISFFLLNLIATDTVTIKGRIVDSDGNPLENTVVISEMGLTLTNKEGIFLLKIQDKSISKIVFKRSGYYEKKISLEEFYVFQEVVLSRKSIEIEGIEVFAEQHYHLPDMINIERIVFTDPVQLEKSLHNAISSISGINVSENPLYGERQTASILGNRAKHTVVMLDGVVLNPSGEEFDLSTIPAEIIQSIEIYKGPSGSLAGSGAIGGIININTVSSSGSNTLELQYSSGSFGLNRYALGLDLNLQSQKIKFLPSGFYLYLSGLKAQNDFKYRQRNDYDLVKRKNNATENYDLYFNLRDSNPLFYWNYKFILHSFRKETPGPTNFLNIYKNSYLRGNSYKNNLSLYRRLNVIDFKLNLNHQQNSVKYDNTNAPVSFYYIKSRNRYETKTATFDLDYKDEQKFLFFKLRNYFNLRLMSSDQKFSYDELTHPLNSIKPVKQSTNSFMFNNLHLLTFNQVTFNADFSNRIDYSDKYNDFYNRIIGASLAYSPDNTYTLGFNSSTAHSIPSFYELYWKGDMQSVGNPDLIPEKSKSINIFSRIEADNGNFLSFSYYKSRIDNLIYWYRTIGGWRPGNIATAEITNYELESSLFFHPYLQFNNSVLLTDAKNKSKDKHGVPTSLYNKKLTYTPEYIVKSNIVLKLNNLLTQSDNLSVAFNYTHTGSQASTPDQLIKPLPSYNVLNSRIGYLKRLSRLSISGNIYLNNLNNKLYEVYSYTPSPGFNWEFKLNLKYNLNIQRGEL